MKLLLIQFRTDQSAPHEQRCIKVHAELEDHHLHVVNPLTHSSVIEHVKIDSFDGVIIGGSGEFNLSSPTSELEMALGRVTPIIDQVLDAKTPLLGMCFGHQLLGQYLGGEVGAFRDGAKTGTFEIALTPAGKADPIKAGLPDRFAAQHGHKDSVVKAPPGAVVLSTSGHDPHASFRYGEHVYAVQFHPELTQQDILFRIRMYPSYTKGKTDEELQQTFRPTPHAPRVLKNFIDGVRHRNAV